MKLNNAFFFALFTLLVFLQITFGSTETPDTIRVLGIRVEFQADEAATTTGNGKFDLSQPSGDYQVDPPPHNRSYFQDHFLFLKNYFKRVSRGQLIVEGDVFPGEEDRAYQLPFPMGSYNPNTTPEAINTGLAKLLRDALMAADSANEIDFSRYQSFVIFHAGVGKDVDLGFDETPQDIPSLFITSDFLQQYLGQPSIQVSGNVNIANGILIPETESQDGLELGLNGILVSNFGSQLGWLDLFSPVTRRSGIGRFGLMDAGLFNGDGLLPAVPCAWTRLEAGWDQPVDIYYSSNEQWTIHPPLSTHEGRIFRIPINENEYFLIENRFSHRFNVDSVRFEMAQGRSDYPTMKEVLLTHFQDQVTFSARGVLVDVKNPDLGLPGNGCLIWHIDGRVIAQSRAENRINADPEHRGVDLEEADGSQDIGQEFDFLSAGGGSENGWVLDMWYQGNTAPVFEQNGNKFSPNTRPNSRSYYNRANSHITISDFSLPDSVMTFRVKLDIYQQNFPRLISPQVYGQVSSMKATDLDFDGKNDLVLTTGSGKILAVNHQGRSVWGGDSLQIARIPEPLVAPPVLFDFSPSAGIQQKRMVVLTRPGTVYGLQFDPTLSFDTLFTPIRCPDSITTPPVAVFLSEHATNVYWGSAAGRVYQLKVQGDVLPFDTVSYTLPRPIRFIHVDRDEQVFALTTSGEVYRGKELLGSEVSLDFPLMGNLPVIYNRAGEFAYLGEGEFSRAEEQLHRFDSPMVSLALYQENLEEPVYFVAGNNFLTAFNYNFTLLSNFPVQIYKPHRETNLFLSPLVGKFFTTASTETYGAVIADPAGVIDGFDIKGKRFADFPLAAGDSLQVTPALLDIDGDQDVELAAVTRAGVLYLWDLASEYNANSWNQIYADELNSNRSTMFLELSAGKPGQPVATLLPENKAYNWPNPNIDNYTFIRYYLTERAEVRIKIFDLAGDLVKELPGTSQPFTDNEVRWDLTGVQSGVYLARIEAQNSRLKDVRIIKIAVVK